MSTKTEIKNDAQVALTVEQLKELLGVAMGAPQAAQLTPDVLEAIMARTAEMSAEAMRRSLKPENTFHPEVSVYSHPEGDRAHPKATLPFELLWLGFPVHKESSVVAWYEMEQYAQLKPGDYTCTLLDRTTLPVTVIAEKSSDGATITKLRVSFKATRENRDRIPSPFIFCYQMNHADRDPRETFVEAMSRLLTIQLQDSKAKERPVALAS